MSRAQRSTRSAFTRVFARYGGAQQNRDLYTRGVWNDPGSAVRRGRETNRRNIDVRQLALRAEDCTARARQLASALANALGRVFS